MIFIKHHTLAIDLDNLRLQHEEARKNKDNERYLRCMMWWYNGLIWRTWEWLGWDVHTTIREERYPILDIAHIKMLYRSSLLH